MKNVNKLKEQIEVKEVLGDTINKIILCILTKHILFPNSKRSRGKLELLASDLPLENLVFDRVTFSF